MKLRRSDWLVVAALLAVAQLETWLTASMAPKVLYAGVAIGLTAPLLWRRQAPVAVLVAVFVPLFALRLADEPFDPAYIMLVLIAAFASAASFADRGRAVAGLLAGLALLGLLIAVEDPAEGAGAGDFVFIAGILAAVWVLALVVRERTSEAGELAVRADRLEREREEQARLAVAEERGRIARELHDVVSHSVSVIAVQAGSMRRRLQTSQPAEADDLSRIEHTAREALAEMRRMLGLLRSDDDDAALAPQPGIDQLDRLVEQVREAGVPVELRVEGTRRDLPPGLDLAAYRIVQEALTNVIKHAGSARAQVDVRYGPGELNLSVRDEGPGPPAAVNGSGAGHGLIGMRERVALYGGSLRTGADGDSGFAVHASLPIPAA